MTASKLSSPLRDGIRQLLTNDWFVVILLFLTAAGARWLFVLNNPHADGFLIYQGKPLSDGCSYTFKAISIAQGHGIPPVQQPAVRPCYPITLACLYTWTGFSLWAVTVLNILISGFTAALIYLCGVRGLNRFCGLGAALFFAIDPSQLLQTPQAGTEPLGLLFFVASVYAALRAFETRRASLFFLTGLFIGLSNLTRTLTIFTLPFYAGLILLLVGIRERTFKNASVYIVLMILGVAIAILPWLVRQERMYRIWSISDNIGEAFYAATSPKYKQWTPAVRQDAEADGIPDTVGDRYRYFMRRAGENMRRNSGFYLHSVGASLWEYANTFNSDSRASPRYAEAFSSAAEAQRAFLCFMVVLLISVSCLLRKQIPFSSSNLLLLIGSISLTMLYYIVPHSLAFLPIITGLVFSWRARRRLAGLVIFGSLAMTALGSAIFANTILFRAILMTDWLFLFYFLAAVWFPIEALTRRTIGGLDTVMASRSGELDECTQFQNTLSLFSRRASWLVVAIVVGFFALSGVRLIALTIANPPKRGERQLTRSEVNAVLRRLRQPPLGVLASDAGDLQVFDDWSRGPPRPQPGQYVVLVQKFDYDYYIPAGKVPPRGRPPMPKPYARSLVILPQFDFTIAGEIPSQFSRQPLIFVGTAVSAKVEAGQRLARLQVDGIALIPFDQHKEPDFARTVCAPPSVLLDLVRRP